MRHKQIFTIDPSSPFHSIDLYIKDALKYKIHAYEPGSVEHAQMAQEASFNLRGLLKIPGDYRIIFMNSQLMVYQILKKIYQGNSSFFVVSGRRSGMLKKYLYNKNTCQVINIGDNKQIELEPAEANKGIDSIFLAFNEPDTGIRIKIDDIKRLVKTFPGTPFLHIDAGEAIPSEDFDFRLADSVTFPAHIGFGLPMGILVWVLKPEMYEKIREFEEVEKNHPWYIDAREYLNLLDIYLLGKVAQDMHHRGIKNIRNECIYKSTILYDALASSKHFSPVITDVKYQSGVTIVARSIENARDIRDKFSAMGLMISIGEGDHRLNQVRFGNFPAHSKEQIEMLVDLLLNPDRF